jgi:hypothetical protein
MLVPCQFFYSVKTLINQHDKNNQRRQRQVFAGFLPLTSKKTNRLSRRRIPLAPPQANKKHENFKSD